MRVTAALLEKFFRGECDEQEQELVREYFRQHPEELAEYLTEDGWEKFQETEYLPSRVSARMLQTIETSIHHKKNVKKLYFRWAAAAAVLLLFAGGYWWISAGDRKLTSGNNLTQNLIQNNKAEIKPALPEWKTTVNYTGKPMPLTLPDGTAVELANASEIRYPNPFTAGKREIDLDGQAQFNVATDKTRPFTVYAGGLYTTALGTVFKITAFSHQTEGKTRVYLLSGKCVIRPDSILQKKGVKEVYLDPGQSMLLDNLRSTVSIERTNGRDGQADAGRAVKKILTFDNEPLAAVLQTIGTAYHLRLVYKPDLLNNMSFTGVFDPKKESLESFLSTIGILNNLTLKQTNKVIMISQ
jgi:ferric-dicitrate binding protein FerR (iron transport regulator)